MKLNLRISPEQRMAHRSRQKNSKRESNNNSPTELDASMPLKSPTRVLDFDLVANSSNSNNNQQTPPGSSTEEEERHESTKATTQEQHAQQQQQPFGASVRKQRSTFGGRRKSQTQSSHRHGQQRNNDENVLEGHFESSSATCNSPMREHLVIVGTCPSQSAQIFRSNSGPSSPPLATTPPKKSVTNGLVTIAPQVSTSRRSKNRRALNTSTAPLPTLCEGPETDGESTGDCHRSSCMEQQNEDCEDHSGTLGSATSFDSLEEPVEQSAATLTLPADQGWLQELHRGNSTTTTKDRRHCLARGTTKSLSETALSPTSEGECWVSSDISSKKPGPGSTCWDKITHVAEKAADLAARGCEEDALKQYDKALKLCRHDVKRVRQQLSQVQARKGATPAPARASIAARLHDDWMRVGMEMGRLRTEQGVLRAQLGQWPAAVACVAEACQVYRKQVTSLTTSHEKDETGAAEIAQVLQQMELVQQRYQRAKESATARSAWHEGICLLRQRLAVTDDPAVKQELYAKVTTKALKLQKLEADLLGEGHPQVADMDALLGALALEQDDFVHGEMYLQKSLGLIQEALGAKHPRTGKSFLQMATVYYRRYQQEQAGAISPSAGAPTISPMRDASAQGSKYLMLAMEHYRLAVDTFRASQTCPALLGSTLNDLAVIYIASRKFDEALPMLRESLTAYEAAAMEEDTIFWDAAQVWRNLGECHMTQKEFIEASSDFMKALDMQRDGRKVFDQQENGSISHLQNTTPVPPLNLVDDQAIADTLRRLGKAFFAAGSLDQSLIFLAEARLIHKSDVRQAVQHNKKGRTTYVLPDRQDQLAQTLHAMGELQEARGDYDQAMKLFNESLQLRLFSDAHRATRTNMIHCAMCLVGMGGVHVKKGEFAAARNVYDDALTYYKAHGLPDNHPIGQMIRDRRKQADDLMLRDLLPQPNETDDSDAGDDAEVSELERRAAMQIGQGNLDAAVLTLTWVMQRRKDSLKQMKEHGLDATAIKQATAKNLFAFGQVLAQKGDSQSAERAYKDSLKMLKKSGSQPDSSEVLDVVERLARLQKGQKHHNDISSPKSFVTLSPSSQDMHIHI